MNQNPYRQFASCYQVIAAVVLIATGTLKAQEYSMTRYDHANGLPTSYIFHVYPDQMGYLWVGCDGGLSRFDGQEFVNYGFVNGLPNLGIDAVYVDRSRRLWIGTRGGIIQMKAGIAHEYGYSGHSAPQFVFGFLELQPDLLLALTDIGVLAWQDSMWQKREFYPSMTDHQCRQMIETPSGLLINYGDLLVKRKPDQSWTVIGEKKQLGFTYLNMVQASGQVYVSTVGGVYRIEQDRLKPIPGPAGRLQDVYAFTVDSEMNCWVGSDHLGVRRYHVLDSTVSQIVFAKEDVPPVSQFLEYPTGVIWMAYGDGLVRINRIPYETILRKDSIKIRSIVQDQDGSVLISKGLMVLKIDPENPFVPELIPVHGRKHWSDLFMDNYTYDETHKKLWLLIRPFEIADVTEDGISIRTNAFEFPHHEIFDILYDHVRKKLVTTHLDVTVPCIEDHGKFSPMHLNGCMEEKGDVYELHQCLDGTLLFSTEAGVIYAIDASDRCRIAYEANKGRGSYCKFFNDPGGDVWMVYTGRGAQRFSVHDTFTLVETLDKMGGLSSDVVTGFCFGPDQRLWIRTADELAVFKKGLSNDRYYKVGSFDQPELNIEVPSINSMISDVRGALWLVSGNALLRFDPEVLDDARLPVPGLQIDGVKLNDEVVDWSGYTDSLLGLFEIPLDPKLPFDFNAISIRYNAILPQSAAKREYSYRLSPMSHNWSEPTSEKNVSFYKLPSGKYSFEVRTRIVGSVWSEPKTFRFYVSTPYWETLWFRVLVVCAAVGVMITAFRYRIRQLNEKARMKDQFRDLELNALKSQMNPHFIHNALNSIQSLILHERSQEASSYISKFAGLLRQVLESGEKTLIPLDQELNALRLYVDLERLRMDMDFTYVDEIDPEVSVHQELIPPLLLQPFVENALWHGLALKRGDKQIMLKISARDGWLHCEIRDNGVGRNFAAQSHVFPEGSLSKSTHITRKRLETFNQTPESDPIQYEDLFLDGQPAGTRVIVRIRRGTASARIPQ